MTALILREDIDGLCTLTLNRPEKRNALDTATFEALDSHIEAIAQATDRIGCVVLRGAGKGFCAGADLKAIGSAPIDPRYKPGIIDRLASLPQPTIAAIHGACTTGGLELALACDLIVADPSAFFADTHGKWGLVGAWGMAQRLRRRIGTPLTKRMMFTSCTVDAVEAKAMGLVDLLAEEGLDAAVSTLSAEILANSWHTNIHAKRILAETDGMGLAEALAQENYRYPGYAPDWQERVERFSKPKL